jgi:hypothetical protein
MSMSDNGIPGWILGLGALGAVAGVAYALRPEPLRIFVSYDYDSDRHYRTLLSAWHANRSFAFTWEDHSTPEVKSKDAGPIKAAITKKLKEADILLVLVGQHTARSRWVRWEISRAKELGLQLVAVKIKGAYPSPPELLNSGTRWARSFSEEAIIKALKGE